MTGDTARRQRAERAQPELCERCGTRLHDNPALGPARLCPQHLAEARAAMGPVGCSTAVIDEGMGEPLPPEPKGTLRADGLKRATSCVLCGAPLEVDDWVVKIPGRGYAQPGCAGDDGWVIE